MAMCASGRRPAWRPSGTSLMRSSGGVLQPCCSCSTSASIFARCPDARFARPRPAHFAHRRGGVPGAGGRWRSRSTTASCGVRANSSSKGELIDPARPLAVAGLRHADGSPAGAEVLTGKWTLIYIGDGALRRGLPNCAGIRPPDPAGAEQRDDARAARVPGHRQLLCDREYFAREQPGLIALDASSPEARRCSRSFPRAASTRCSSSIRSAI